MTDNAEKKKHDMLRLLAIPKGFCSSLTIIMLEFPKTMLIG